MPRSKNRQTSENFVNDHGIAQSSPDLPTLFVCAMARPVSHVLRIDPAGDVHADLGPGATAAGGINRWTASQRSPPGRAIKAPGPRRNTAAIHACPPRSCRPGGPHRQQCPGNRPRPVASGHVVRIRSCPTGWQSPTALVNWCCRHSSTSPPWSQRARGALRTGRSSNATWIGVASQDLVGSCLFTVISGVGRAGSSGRHARHRSGGSGRCVYGWNAPPRIRGGGRGRWRHAGVGVPACLCTLASWCLARS
jgi:hypothetical protein